MIDQITVFLENSEGRLAALTRCLAAAHVNMDALTIAESSDFGLVRIICPDPDAALAALQAADFRATKTKVVAVEVPDRPGGLAELLDVIDALDANIEYGYCFATDGDKAIDVLKIRGNERDEAIEALRAAGFALIDKIG